MATQIVMGGYGPSTTTHSRALKIIGDHASDFLCLQVISVVIAVRQNVGARHDAAFDLGAKPFGTTFLVQIQQILRGRSAVAKLDAVKATQV